MQRTPAGLGRLCLHKMRTSKHRPLRRDGEAAASKPTPAQQQPANSSRGMHVQPAGRTWNSISFTSAGDARVAQMQTGSGSEHGQLDIVVQCMPCCHAQYGSDGSIQLQRPSWPSWPPFSSAYSERCGTRRGRSACKPPSLQREQCGKATLSDGAAAGHQITQQQLQQQQIN